MDFDGGFGIGGLGRYTEAGDWIERDDETETEEVIMRIQISTSVSRETRRQADELMSRRGYSLRDIIAIAIEKLHAEKIGNRATLYNVDERFGDCYPATPEEIEQEFGITLHWDTNGEYDYYGDDEGIVLTNDPKLTGPVG